jgi:hypothetical protein
MNYSGARPGIPESGWFRVVQRCTPDTVRCTIFQHTQVLLLQLNCVPNLISFLVLMVDLVLVKALQIP